MTSDSALRILIIGALSVVASCAPLGTAIHQVSTDRPQLELSPPAIGTTLESRVELTAGRGARLVLWAEIQGPSVAKLEQDGATVEQLQFRFPLSFNAYDTDGEPVFEQLAVLARDQAEDTRETRSRPSALRLSRDEVNAGGGQVALAVAFHAFEVPDSGALDIALTIDPDDSHDAELQITRLAIEHDRLDPTVSTVFGLFMLVGGWVTATIGAVGYITARQPLAAAALAGESLSSAIKNRAMWCHLAGFAGILMPVVGHLLVPLLLWRHYRKAHAFIDHHGRDAINFQLSIMVYALLAFSLVLALIGLLMVPLLITFQIVAMILAARAASAGKRYEYPLTIRFVA